MTISLYNVIVATNKKYSYVKTVYIPIWVYKINVSLDTINRVGIIVCIVILQYRFSL